MAESFLGEIRMFGGTFAPRQWAFCDGQLLTVAQHTALFSLYGTAYGGDGRTNFAVPDMRGRVPVSQGRGPGLSDRILGQRFGSEDITLTLDQLPPHSHGLLASSAAASTNDPSSAVLAAGEAIYEPDEAAAQATMHTNSIGATGGNGDHPNSMPYQCVSFIVSLSGEFPPRS